MGNVGENADRRPTHNKTLRKVKYTEINEAHFKKQQSSFFFLKNCTFPSFSRIREQEYFQAAAMLGICSCVSCTLETCSLRIEGDVVALHWLRTHLEPNHSVCSFKKKRKGIIMGSVMLFHTLRVPTFQQSCLSSCCHSSVCVPLRLFYFCLT